MFFPGSRYANAGTYIFTRPDGTTVTVTNLPLPLQNPILGFHQRQASQRLDHIAFRYLNDATAFWQLCDANNAVVPDALATRNQVGIPTKAG